MNSLLKTIQALIAMLSVPFVMSTPGHTLENSPTINLPETGVGYEIITGRWQVEDSNAIFEIHFIDGVMQIKGYDVGDGEQFLISEASWDGKYLKGKFLMPSTSHTTWSKLTLVDRDTLKGIYSGDTSGAEIWRRKTYQDP